MDVPVGKLVMSMLPLLLVCGVSVWLKLDLASHVGTSTARTFLQLSVVGLVLVPIFEAGTTHPWIVVLYCTAMCVLAAREASNRSRYWFRGIFACVLVAMLVNVGLVGLFAFAVVIQPTPVWDPRYCVPLTGMLLGNCINGVSLSLNALLTSFVEQKAEVELLLSFGADKWEASARPLRDAVRTGTMPTLNSMAVIGLISIPGMMTGQVLGGSPPEVAARYQILIMYLIAVCSFGTIISVLVVALSAAFDADHRLLSEKLFKRGQQQPAGAAASALSSPSSSLSRRALDCFASVFCVFCHLWTTSKQGLGYKQVVSKPESKSTSKRGASAAVSGGDDLEQEAPNRVTITSVRGHHTHSRGPSALSIQGVTRVVPLLAPGSQRTRTLFEGLTVELSRGEIATVHGPSGCGKSQLLRLVAGLVPMEDGALALGGVRRANLPIMTHWRQKVRYVTQYKIDSPGTPRDFVETVCALAVNRSDPAVPSADDMAADALQLLLRWNMQPECMAKEWRELSGGEAQRVIVAIAVASRPQVLLLDESTSALDLASKLKVEESIQNLGVTVLWITHDDDQVKRMATSSPLLPLSPESRLT